MEKRFRRKVVRMVDKVYVRHMKWWPKYIVMRLYKVNEDGKNVDVADLRMSSEQLRGFVGLLDMLNPPSKKGGQDEE